MCAASQIEGLLPEHVAYHVSVSFANVRRDSPVRMDEAWVFDTGANITTCDPNDPCVVRFLDQEPMALGTSGGEVIARPALIRTPYGPRKGLTAHGSPRLMHGGSFQEFRSVKRVCQSGRCYKVDWRDGIPVTCGDPHSPEGRTLPMAGVALQEHREVTGNKRRKVARKFRRRFQKHFWAEDLGDGEPDPEQEDSEEDEPRGNDPGTPNLRGSPVSDDDGERSLDLESDECCRVLNFDDLVTSRAYVARIFDPFTHKHCRCMDCRIAKMQHAPHLRSKIPAGEHVGPGDLIVGDLCTDWVPSRDGGPKGSVQHKLSLFPQSCTNAFIMKDIATGLKYVRPLPSKIPQGVKEGLNEFRERLLAFRAFLEVPPSQRPWVFHTDQGGEFTGTVIKEYVASQGGVLRLAPKGAHVAHAENVVRDVLQGTRVGLYSAGLPATFWPFAARQYVHNSNCDVNGWREFLQTESRPAEKQVFGRLVWFKPTDDLKASGSKGEPTSIPGCFLGCGDHEMRRGVWAAYLKGRDQKQTIGVTSVNTGQPSGSGLVWADDIDGKPAMAFKRVVRDLHEITLPSKAAVASGHPGMTPEELERWVANNPPPAQVIDPANRDCKACRGRNRAHTYSGSCMLAGLSQEQLTEFRRWARGKTAEERRKRLEGYRKANASAGRRLAEYDEAEAEGFDSGERTAPRGRKSKRALGAVETSPRPSAPITWFEKRARRWRKAANRAARVLFHTDTLSTWDICGKCVANFTRVGPVPASEEPEPEPGVASLRSATLECPDSADLVQQCLENSLSPTHFGQMRGGAVDGDDLNTQMLGSDLCRKRVAFVTRKMTKAEREGDGAPAIIKEVHSLVDYGLFGEPCSEQHATDSAPGATVSGLVMLSHVKHAERPGHEVYKGRAVVRGDDVRVLATGERAGVPEGVEVGQVAALEEVRAVMSYSTLSGNAVQKVDIKNAYLSAKFEIERDGAEPIELWHYLRVPKEIWQHFPAHLRPKDGMRSPLWRMLRAGYGHELSGHIFMAKLKRWLLQYGFTPLEGTTGLYARGSLLLATYVDDLLASGSSQELAEFWEALGKAFTFKSEPSDVSGDEFLGIDLTRRDSDTHYGWDLGMSAYILDTVREYERLWRTTARPSRTPGTVYIRSLNKSTSQACAEPPTPKALQSIVGRLLWICRTARPDLSHMSSGFGARVLTWDVSCEKELARTMGYLLLTHDAQLTFRWPRDRSSLESGKLSSTIFTDADWTEPRSQNGMLACLRTGDSPDSVSGMLPIHWASKKQPLAADSSTAAEIIAAHYGLREAFAIMSSFGDFLRGCGLIEATPKVHLRVDNSTCLKHVNKSPTDTFFAYSKACAVRISLLSELRQAGVILCSHVKSDLNPADVFTKPFSPADHIEKSKLTGLDFPCDSAVHVANVAVRGYLWQRLRRL